MPNPRREQRVAKRMDNRARRRAGENIPLPQRTEARQAIRDQRMDQRAQRQEGPQISQRSAVLRADGGGTLAAGSARTSIPAPAPAPRPMPKPEAGRTETITPPVQAGGPGGRAMTPVPPQPQPQPPQVSSIREAINGAIDANGRPAGMTQPINPQVQGQSVPVGGPAAVPQNEADAVAAEQAAAQPQVVGTPMDAIRGAVSEINQPQPLGAPVPAVQAQAQPVGQPQPQQQWQARQFPPQVPLDSVPPEWDMYRRRYAASGGGRPQGTAGITY